MCEHKKLLSKVVSTDFHNNKMQVIVCVCCEDCKASWTAADYDAYQTEVERVAV